MQANKKLPDWWLQAARVLRPPEKMTVSEWADRYRVLDEKTSAMPGQWKTSTTPYLRGVMDAFNDPNIEEIIFVKPTQVGGTEALMNMLGYCIDQDPSSALVVYPTLDLAEYASELRIQPMVGLCRSLKDKYFINSKRLELQFDGMFVALSGANSPASLAARACRYLLLDEEDKFPANAGKEADPSKLAEERTKTYAYNRKIFRASTPTFKSGKIWKAYEAADERRSFFVPCPHCGHKQTLKFTQIKWPKGSSAEEARELAYYECNKCVGRISDSYKISMLRAGKWEADEKSDRPPRKVGFRINTLYSPWVRFGDIAYEFLKSKDFPELLQNFINSWLAKPWEETRQRTDADVVKERQSEYEAGVVPPNIIGLTAGADVQSDRIYWTVRAWGENLTSWNIAHGECFTLEDLEFVMNQQWKDTDGQTQYISLCCIDSGDQTDDIYNFTFDNSDWAVAVKGASQKMFARFRISTINKVDSKAYGMRLIIVSTGDYKNSIARGMNKPNGKGSWMVHKDIDDDYCNQVTAEHKIVTRNKRGQEVEEWTKKQTHGDNHYLDCEVYAFVAADLLQYRFVSLDEQPAAQPQKPPDVPKKDTNSWIKQREGWLDVGSK